MSDLRKTNRRGEFYWKGEPEKPYVSVTRVLSILDKPALRWWYGDQIYNAMILDPTLSRTEAHAAPYKSSKKAASRGTTIHSIIQAYKVSGFLAEVKKLPPHLRGYAQAFNSWVSDNKIEILEQEKTVFSERFGYAGTTDLITKVNGKRQVVDVKTNKDGNVYQESFLQVSAYINALKENGIEVSDGYILALSETGKYTYKQAEDCFEQFLAAKKLWVWSNKEVCKKLGYGKN
jgi:CRISPR/Cas system-associated exonuclease Cas4 (RecB family)